MSTPITKMLLRPRKRIGLISLAKMTDLVAKSGKNTRSINFDGVIVQIVSISLNEKENVKICAKTVRNYVNNGRAGETPEKRGEKGKIVPQAYKALCAALESFVKLAAQEGKKSINRPSLI
jgi:hypothetical protein